MLFSKKTNNKINKINKKLIIKQKKINLVNLFK